MRVWDTRYTKRRKPEEDVEKVKSAGKEFAEAERNKLKEVDAEDKLLAKEKKREKKSKRKERERVRCSSSRVGVADWVLIGGARTCSCCRTR
jgi:hypothetical protein